jgi:hypothetical protein
MSEHPPQPDTLQIDLNDGPLTESELIRLAWVDLFGYMKEICDTLNGGGGLDWLHLPQDARLFCQRPCPTEHKIIYRVGASEYLLQVRIELDLGLVLYRFDPCPFIFQRVIAIRSQQAFFRNPDLAPDGEVTLEAAARSLIFEFLLLDSDSARLATG